MALLSTTPLNAEQSELLAFLEAGSQHIVLVIDDVLNIGQLESDEFRVCAKWVSPVRQNLCCRGTAETARFKG